MSLTFASMPGTPRPMGRKKLWTERILLPLADGTLARIATVLLEGQDRTEFIREAVDREIERREAARMVAGRSE
jgi:hypothetical protein